MIINDVDHYNVKGLLIYDESIINQSTWSMLINVYTGICGAEDLIPIPSSQRNDFKDLPIVFDATQGGKKLGKWDSESEAYVWVINQYKTLSRKGAPMAFFFILIGRNILSANFTSFYLIIINAIN